MNKTIEELAAEMREQDEALKSAKEQLAAMGEVQFQMPKELLEQLDDTCAVHASNTIQLCAVRA